MAWDYIVVGAGSAGCAVAARLSEDASVRVLLLEAGPADRHPLYHMPAGFAQMTKGIGSWGWHTVPQRHLGGRVLRYTQAKVLGGGSTINAQVYTRGNARDYDAWESEEGCVGWAYRDVLPYFRKAEGNQRFANEYHGTDGPLGVSVPVNPLPIGEAFIRAAQQFGIPYNPDFNGARQEGVGHYQVTVRDARRSSAAAAYLRPARNRRNLTLRTQAMIRRIVAEHGRAVGVEIGSAGGTEIVRAEREVILCCGAIGSPRLLMLSGIGPADHLRAVGVEVVHDLPGVGGNLHDHLDLYAISECTGDHTYDRYVRPHRMVWAGAQYILFHKGPVASTLFETGGFWFSGPGVPYPDLQFHLGLGSGIEAGVAKLRNPGVTLNSDFCRPASRGTVRLASSDPAAAPLIDPNYWEVEDDRRRSLEGLRIAREILRQPALKPFVLAERLPGANVTEADLIEYAHRTCKVDHHPVGTCRMGNGPDAVVRLDLRVHGLVGLRVADASVMPRIPSSNTNAPTIMVGEKAADLIRGIGYPSNAATPMAASSSSSSWERPLTATAPIASPDPVAAGMPPAHPT
jgi:choline dehydrogenase-like flavoprotein